MGLREGRTHKVDRGGIADSTQANSFLLLGFLLATAALDNADEEEKEDNGPCHSHSDERPFGYWCLGSGVR